MDDKEKVQKAFAEITKIIDTKKNTNLFDFCGKLGVQGQLQLKEECFESLALTHTTIMAMKHKEKIEEAHDLVSKLNEAHQKLNKQNPKHKGYSLNLILTDLKKIRKILEKC